MNLMQNLPDMRTAQRLVDVLDQLERALHQQSRPGQVAAPVAAAPVDLSLRAENARLKKAQQQALKRLDVLIERLGEQAAAEEQPAQESEAA